jgi:hypothetical protein
VWHVAECMEPSARDVRSDLCGSRGFFDCSWYLQQLVHDSMKPFASASSRGGNP